MQILTISFINSVYRYNHVVIEFILFLGINIITKISIAIEKWKGMFNT